MIRLALIGLVVLGLWSSTRLAYSHYQSGEACPILGFVPACYIALAGYLMMTAAVAATIAKPTLHLTWVFWLGLLAAGGLALLGSGMELAKGVLIGNTDTVYATAILELDRDGPTVVVIPPKCGPGTVDDAWQRFVVDMGAPGLDKGKGGKYLILPPDYKGDLDPAVGGEFAEVDGEKHIVAKSPTYVNWLVLRGFLVDGKPDAANAMFKNGLKTYPLKEKRNLRTPRSRLS